MSTDMTLGELAQGAAKELPDRYEIRICLENGSGGVELYYEGDPVDYPSNHETLEESLLDALSWAVIRERGPNADWYQYGPNDDLDNAVPGAL